MLLIFVALHGNRQESVLWANLGRPQGKVEWM